MDTRPCACGCGQPVPLTRQRRQRLRHGGQCGVYVLGHAKGGGRPLCRDVSLHLYCSYCGALRVSSPQNRHHLRHGRTARAFCGLRCAALARHYPSKAPHHPALRPARRTEDQTRAYLMRAWRAREGWG